MTTTAFPLGAYLGNPNGNDAAAQAAFEAQYNAFVQDMGGARPQFMDTFTDFTQAPSAWGSNAAWDAWSWAQTGAAYVGPGSGIVPVVGVPLASNAGGWANVDTFYQQIVSGMYDADYKAIVDAWASNGYKTVQFRIGYEFNSSLMPWSPSNSASPTADADFVAAFQHIASLIHAAGVVDGITAQVVWNPTDINWSADPTQLYPGNQYVDIISTDAYSPAYPNDLATYASATATTAGPPAASQASWAASVSNLEHAWEYTNASQSNPTPALGSTGWSLENAIAFAALTGKPLSISETGAGTNGSGLGPADDPAFAGWLASALAAAQAEGLKIQNVNIWDTNVSDGTWAFSGGALPQEEAAWGQHFGAASVSTSAGAIPTVTLGSGPDTLALSVSQDAWLGNAQFTVAVDGVQIGGVQTVDAAALDASGISQTFAIDGNFAGAHTVTVDFLNDAWGGTAATDRNLYVTGATIDGTAIPGGTLTEMSNGAQSFAFSTVASSAFGFTDSQGHSFTEAPIAAGSAAFYGNQTGLDNNIYQWVYGGVTNVSTGAWAYVTTVRLTDTGGASYALHGFVESDATLTGGPTQAGQAATLTIDTAQRGTILLGSGNDNVAFTAANAWGSAADNTVAVTMGSGSDVFSLTGSNDATRAVIFAGSGTDRMSFTAVAGATVFGGTGSASVTTDGGAGTFVAGSGSLTVASGGGADTFVFHAGAGLMSIADFNPLLGDTLNVDSALLASVHEQVTAAGLMISFGTDATHGILLQGATSLGQTVLHPI
jgi:hypothetical protein